MSYIGCCDSQIGQKLIFCASGKTALQDIAGIHEILQIIVGASGNPRAYFFKIRFNAAASRRFTVTNCPL